MLVSSAKAALQKIDTGYFFLILVHPCTNMCVSTTECNSLALSHSMSRTPRTRAITLCHPSPPAAPVRSSAISHHSLRSQSHPVTFCTPLPLLTPRATHTFIYHPIILYLCIRLFLCTFSPFRPISPIILCSYRPSSVCI